MFSTLDANMGYYQLALHENSVMEPLRVLIKDSSKPCYCFIFEEQHKQSFTELKKMMSSTEVLHYYNPSKLIKIYCDASIHVL